MAKKHFSTALVLVGLFAAGCSGATESESAAKVQVVVSTSILGEPISNLVACAGGETEVLIPIGASDHDYTPSSAQVASMIEADLVVLNGLGLESGLADAVENAKSDGAVVFEVGEFVDPIAPYEAEHADEHGDEHADEHAHEHGEFDPHFWMDMQRMATGIAAVGAELATITGDDAFATCGEDEAAKIRNAETEVTAILDQISTANRKLVTDHYAFNYFAAAYGFEMFGAIIPSTADLAAPSSAELSELAHVIEDHQIKAIFGGIDANQDLAAAVTEEVGYEVQVGTLYTGSLGEAGSGAETYVGMMKTNAETLLAVLG